MARVRNTFQKYLRYSTMGLELGLSVIVGLLIGQALDNWLGTEPWLLLLFLLLGMVAGFRSVWRLLRETQRERSGAGKDNGGPGRGGNGSAP